MNFEPQIAPPSSGSEGPVEQTFLQRHGISPVLFAFIALLLVFILYQIVGGVIALLVVGTKPTAENIAAFRIATTFGQLVFILIPTLLLSRLATLDLGSFLRLKRPRLPEMAWPFVGIFSLQQILQVYMVVQGKIPLPDAIRPTVEELQRMMEEAYRVLISAHTVPEFFLVVLVAAIVPSVVEELFFRGLIQRSFERGLGVRRGLIVTSVIFAAYHINPFTFIPLFVLGLYIGFLVRRSDSLWPGVAAHFYNNFFACSAMFAFKEEAYIVTGKPDELSAFMLLTTFVTFSVVFVISTYYFMAVRSPNPSPKIE